MTNKDTLKRLIDISAGRRQAELVFRNAQVADLFSHTVYKGSVAVDGGIIVGIGAYEGEREIDVSGKFILPGFIDSHVHIESSLSTPEQYARAVMPRGTTSIIADPHEIANVRGLAGIRYMIEASKNLPLHIHFMLPSCVPATDFEHAGAVLDAAELEKLIDDPSVLGLGELMDYPSVIAGAESILEKIIMTNKRGKLIDGHGPMIEGKDLHAYVISGVRTEHECTTPEEMRDRIRQGMYILIREGSAARNLIDLIGEVNPHNARRCLFCTDDRQPQDILSDGHIDNHLRIAVKRGIDPLTALSMASLNAAECYRLKGKGAIAPGYDADLVVVEDLADFKVKEVYSKGNLTVKDGELIDFPKSSADTSPVTNTVNIMSFGIERLVLHLKSEIARVIRVMPESLVTEEVKRKVQRDPSGNFISHPDLDILKLAVIERHKATGNIGLALVENYKLKGGALASTIAHDSHNIIVLGDNDPDMYAAVMELVRTGGGITLVQNRKVLATLELPIAGLMSDQKAEFISDKLKEMSSLAFEKLGVNSELDPFMTLSFLSLPVIPELKLTDRGLFDVRSFTFTSLSI